MHARIVSLPVRPGSLDEGAAIYRDSIIPAAMAQQGCKGALLLADDATGRALSITLWETQENLLAGESSDYLQAQIAKFATLATGSPTTEHFEVPCWEF